MKTSLFLMLTCLMLAGCTRKADTTTTTTTTTTDVSESADTTATDTTADTTTGVSDTADTAATDTTAETGTAADSTLANDDSASTSEEADMAAGDGLEGTVTDFDGTAKTMTLNEDDKNYAVNVSDSTVYEGVDNAASSAEEFWGTDRSDQKVAVEGRITDGTLSADKITLQE
ncbi:hypothetical protein DKM44_06605 [Deinococcus irradiatisoli]|uniref:DUF5666 domain-containing protein n=1 Tax=Deinococcus irradiatisoli TaxID=2202254 RepID=A0A2Z3JMN5_9DEIO|nr:hypothetical protein [Deinococcus irradiatisoli]AWN22938.1 hypothetical protein DKM44_06605 [Deinococcus irradiatisoli]